MSNHRILPFYLTYPLPYSYQEDDNVIEDLDYLMQMYPAEAKKYQKRIALILDKLDYEGSVIYDQYPDRITLYKMARDVGDIIMKEEERNGSEMTKEKQEWLLDLIVILLFYEIYRRRHNRHRGYLRF